MRDLGFSNVHPLRGGISGWRERGYPMHPTRHHSHRPAAVPLAS